MIGVAREVSGLTGNAPPHDPTGQRSASRIRRDSTLPRSRSSPLTCVPGTSRSSSRDLAVGPSPAWMQQRLRKVGVRPINNLVDITNYVMFEWGQPLHAFDYDLLVQRARNAGEDRPRIVVRRAGQGESLVTLDGVKRELDTTQLVIADAAGPIALAGIMGGAETAIHDGTKNLLLESATFDRTNIRLTAQKLKMSSDSSRRFIWGVPASLNALASARAASLVEQIAGGSIVPGCADVYPVPQPQHSVYLTTSEVRRKLGLDLPLPAIADSLGRLGFSSREISADALPKAPCDGTFGLQQQPGEGALEVHVPWYRLDVAVPADLTEEVGRVLGFGAIPPTLLADTLPEQQSDSTLKTEEWLRDMLVAAGLQETINYTLTTAENHLRMRVIDPAENVRYVTLANPMSGDRVVMRRSMFISAVENLVFNQRYTDRMATFEIGRVYLLDGPEDTLPREDRRRQHCDDRSAMARRASSGRFPSAVRLLRPERRRRDALRSAGIPDRGSLVCASRRSSHIRPNLRRGLD